MIYLINKFSIISNIKNIAESINSNHQIASYPLRNKLSLKKITKNFLVIFLTYSMALRMLGILKILDFYYIFSQFYILDGSNFRT